MRLRQLLAHKRQQLSVGEVEQHGADREHHQGPALEQHSVAGGLPFTLQLFLSLAVAEAARPVQVYGAVGDGQHGGSSEHRKDRHQQEHGALREEVANRARPTAIATLPAWSKAALRPMRGASAAHPTTPKVMEATAGPNTSPATPIRLFAIITGQKKGRTKIVTAAAETPVSMATTRPRFAGVASIKAPIGVRTSRPSRPAHRGHQARVGLAPVLLRHQEHVEVRPDRPTHVGEQKVEGVERRWPEGGRSRLCFCSHLLVPLLSGNSGDHHRGVLTSVVISLIPMVRCWKGNRQRNVSPDFDQPITYSQATPKARARIVIGIPARQYSQKEIVIPSC
jgi:hypothetical protein